MSSAHAKQFPQPHDHGEDRENSNLVTLRHTEHLP